MKTFLLDHWKNLSAVLIAVVIFATIVWQKHKIENLRKERDEARASLVSYQIALTELQADTSAKINALEAESVRQTERTKNLERLLGQIEGASDEEDGIVAPVLRDAINGLYGADTASKANKAGSAAKSPVLRGRPSAAKP